MGIFESVMLTLNEMDSQLNVTRLLFVDPLSMPASTYIYVTMIHLVNTS